MLKMLSKKDIVKFVTLMGFSFVTFHLFGGTALAATTTDIYWGASSGAGDTWVMIANFMNLIINWLWYIAMWLTIAKNVWDVAKGDWSVWDNVKDAAIWIAVVTILIKVFIPTITWVGEKVWTDVQSTVK